MPARPVWSGFISFGLVTVPVRAFTCNSRIQYKKVCAVHGELRPDEIVSGYEFAQGQYVTFDPTELEKLRSAKDKTINISAFILPDAVRSPGTTAGAAFLIHSSET